MATVVHVVSTVGVSDIDIVSGVPVVGPAAGPWINDAEPKSVVLVARVSADDQEGKAAEQEVMRNAEVTAVAVVRDAIAVVSAALRPVAVV